MKKPAVLVFFFAIFWVFAMYNAKAQPNGGFEAWHTEYSFQNPDEWATLNFLTLTSPPNPLSAFKVTGIDTHSGNFALKLKTIAVTTNPAPAMLSDSAGVVFTGNVTT